MIQLLLWICQQKIWVFFQGNERTFSPKRCACACAYEQRIYSIEYIENYCQSQVCKYTWLKCFQLLRHVHETQLSSCMIKRTWRENPFKQSVARCWTDVERGVWFGFSQRDDIISNIEYNTGHLALQRWACTSLWEMDDMNPMTSENPVTQKSSENTAIKPFLKPKQPTVSRNPKQRLLVRELGFDYRVMIYYSTFLEASVPVKFGICATH